MESRYGQLESFLTRFNPDCQRELCTNPDECFFGDYPTLTDTRLAYGVNAAEAWMIPQLYNLSEYCGCRDKLQGVPMKECAFIISTEYHYLKVSELMLFFHRFKAGRYGRFFGSVDPLVITTALRQFVRERGDEYERHEKKLQEQREKEWRRNAITYEEHLRRKGVAV